MNVFVVVEEKKEKEYANRILSHINFIDKIWFDSFDKHINEIDFFIFFYDKDFDNNSHLREILKKTVYHVKNKKRIISLTTDGKPTNNILNKYEFIDINKDDDVVIGVLKATLSRIDYDLIEPNKETYDLDDKDAFHGTKIPIILYLIIIPLILILIEIKTIAKNINTIFILIIVIFMLLTLIINVLMNINYKVKETWKIINYSNQVDDIVENKNNNEKKNIRNDNDFEVLRFMGLNLKEIKEYYVWGQKQVKMAFNLAVVLCVLGFFLLTVSVYLACENKLSLTIIPTIGGVVTELIAGTTLIVYKSSLKQLNNYHKTLHENERFLSSVNLLGNFENKELKDKMLKAIIENELQMNIFSIQNKQVNNTQEQKTKEILIDWDEIKRD